MNITQGVPLMLRAAKQDIRKARSQWPLGICACVFAAAVAGLIAWGM